MKDNKKRPEDLLLPNQMNREEPIPFEALVEENEAGLFYLENDLIIYANPSFARIFDINPTLLIGTSILDQVGSEDRPLLEEGIQRMMEGDQDNFSNELELKCSKKGIHYFSVHLKIHTSSEGNIRIIGASRDASSRVKKFKELEQVKSMYEALYNNIVDGILIYNYDKEKIIDYNPAAGKLFGIDKPEDLLGKNRNIFIPHFSKYFPGIDSHKVTKDHGRRVMNNEAFKTPGVFIKTNGEEMIVYANVVPTLRKYGEAFIIFHDKTKGTLAKILHQETEKKYRAIFQNSHEGIVYTDAIKKIPKLVNDNALALFGVTSLEELLKLVPSDFFANDLIDGMLADKFYKYKIDEAVANGKVEIGFWLKKQTGEVIRVSGYMISDLSQLDQPMVITFLQDVTKLHLAQLAIEEKNKELKRYIDSNLELENFAYFASHDLQTPLRSMISFTQLLEKSLKGKISNNEQEYMDFIICSSKNMKALINDLLLYSRVNTSNIKIQKIDIKTLLVELFSELKSIIYAKKVRIELDYLPEYINADRTKVRQLFQNLITNAIKFSQTEEIPKISINCLEQKNEWLFSVKDNGIGVAPEFQEKIFLLFKRLHTSDKYNGTGIGLAMVKKIIDQHNGRIWMESEEGEGATFWFTIKKTYI